MKPYNSKYKSVKPYNCFIIDFWLNYRFKNYSKFNFKGQLNNNSNLNNFIALFQYNICFRFSICFRENKFKHKLMAKKNISVTKLLSPSKQIQFDIYFLNRFLINYDLESIVAIHQGKTVKEPEESTLKKIFKIIYISNLFIFAILQILKIVIKDDYFLLFIRDVYRYAEGRSEFYQSNFLTFSIVGSGIYLMYFDVHKMNWLVNLAHLQGFVPPIQNGMFDIDAVIKLLKRCKTIISICLCVI